MKLIFVRNPLTPDKREITYVEEKATVAAHIAPIVRLWPGTDFSVSINGHRLQQEEWKVIMPGDDDNLVVQPILEGGLSNFFRTIFDIAVIYFVTADSPARAVLFPQCQSFLESDINWGRCLHWRSDRQRYSATAQAGQCLLNLWLEWPAADRQAGNAGRKNLRHRQSRASAAV